MKPVVTTSEALELCYSALESDDEAVRDAGHTIMSYLTFGLRLPHLVLPESCAPAWDKIKNL